MISKSSVLVLLAFTVLGLVVSGLLGTLFPHDYGTPETPFGTLSTASPAAQVVRTADVTQVPRTLQLAPQPTVPPVPAAPRDVMVTPEAPPPKPVEAASPVQAAAFAKPTAPTPPAEPPVPALPPTLVASNAPVVPLAAATSPVSADRPDPEVPSPAARPAGDADAIDINKASVDALNHLPGMGMIGRTIVRHRPYRSIQDLVDKRVLRLSAFQKVKSRIKVD